MTCDASINLSASNTCPCSIGFVYDITNPSLCKACDIASNCSTCDPNNPAKCETCSGTISLSADFKCPCPISFVYDFNNKS